MRNHVYEKATETAKKIRAMLKRAFPGVKFSVTSSTYSMGSSVYASWTDGPMPSQVDGILNRFKSGTFDGMQDMYVATGYEWEGQLVSGAKYVSGSRQLSPQRREQILAKLNVSCEADYHGDYRVYEWEQAEQELIDEGELQGYISQLPKPAAIADPETDPEQPNTFPEALNVGNVIAFPVRDPEVVAKLLASLTAEQKLKLQLLQVIIGEEITGKQLLDNPLSIDEMFKAAAEKIYG